MKEFIEKYIFPWWVLLCVTLDEMSALQFLKIVFKFTVYVVGCLLASAVVYIGICLFLLLA